MRIQNESQSRQRSLRLVLKITSITSNHNYLQETLHFRLFYFTASSILTKMSDELPPLPYVPDACFYIKPHNPPPPFDDGQWYINPQPKDWNWHPWPKGVPRPSTAIERCLAHPPRKTTVPQDQIARRLVITRQIRCGEGVAAQLVECHLGDPKAKLVAKIFDPLYLFDDEWHSPTYFSERYYSCEAAAYMRIRERGLNGKFTPRFDGCWSFEIPVRINADREARREVRLILQQFIPGDTMEALIESGKAQNISIDVRMDIIARLMEIHSKLDFIGVRHEDSYTRNVIVSKHLGDKWHVTLIDFSHSGVMGLENSKWHRRRDDDAKLPRSPITVCYGHWPVLPLPVIEEHWIDKKYRSSRERLRWMNERWGKSSGKSSQYQPVDESQLV